MRKTVCVFGLVANIFATFSCQTSPHAPRRVGLPSSDLPVRDAVLSEAQKQGLAHATSALLVVRTTYRDFAGRPLSNGPNLPFESVARSLLSHAGIVPVGERENADVAIAIDAAGGEFASLFYYQGMGNGRMMICGSVVSGQLTVTAGRLPPVRRQFKGTVGPHSIVRTSASEFDTSFRHCGFTEHLMEILRAAEGPGFLYKASGDSNALVREVSSRMLGKLDSADSVAWLGKLANDPHPFVCHAAAEALVASTNALATSMLIRALDTRDYYIRKDIVQCLGRRRDPQSVDAIAACMEKETASSDITSACATALAEIGDIRGFDPLLAKMRNNPGLQHYDARMKIVDALRKITGQHMGDDVPEWEKWKQTVAEYHRNQSTTATQLDKTSTVAATNATRRIIFDRPGQNVAMEFCWIPPGSFWMGSPPVERERDSDEGPQHRVLITKGLWMGKCEVSQRQYQLVMNCNPSRFKGVGPDAPVDSVTWQDAKDFCGKLQQMLPTHMREMTVRLPTEAEWEYACRAGSTTPFHCGMSMDSNFSNCAGPYPDAPTRTTEQRKTTMRAGSYPANAWGLCDMHGNVWEWCWDGKREYTSAAATDPEGQGTSRVTRGGGWSTPASRCRSASRGSVYPDHWSMDKGFRVVIR